MTAEAMRQETHRALREVAVDFDVIDRMGSNLPDRPTPIDVYRVGWACST